MKKSSTKSINSHIRVEIIMEVIWKEEGRRKREIDS